MTDQNLSLDWNVLGTVLHHLKFKSTTKSTNKVKNTLKQIICRCCFYLTPGFSGLFFFKTSRFACDGGWKV